jgi:pimeloyl-ACP methyl ester carboxylesterase
VPASATGGAEIALDPARVSFFGHSQGSMHGSLALAHTNDYSATVLSGNGASLMHALLSKTKPENIAQGIPFLLGGDFDQDLRLFGGDHHPVLSIVQQWIDPADPLNFARALTRERLPGITPKSVFQTYGHGDTYSPPDTMRRYAAAAVLDVAEHDPSVTSPDPIAHFAEVPVPLAGNYTDGPSTVTLALRQYAPPTGRDGHFVVFDVASANEDVVRFLSMNAAGDVPAVGQ